MPNTVGNETRSAPFTASDSVRLIATVSRSGDKKEALGGPLIYTIVLLLATLVFFRDSPVGVVAVSQMAIGDGLADIVGRRWGSVKWPFSEKKSFIGSAGFVIGAFLGSAALLQLLVLTNHLSLDVTLSLPKLLLISVACALTELVPIGDDNLSVPIMGAALTYFLLQS